RPPRLGARSRQAVAAEWLYADDRADHVAVHVGVADRCIREYLPPKRLQPGLHSKGQAVMAIADGLQHLLYVPRSVAHDVQDRSEFLMSELSGILEFDQ